MKSKFSIKNILNVMLAMLFISAFYLLYLFLLGIPKTQARQYYLKAQDYYQNGNDQNYIKNMKIAIEFFAEPYLFADIENKGFVLDK